MSGEICLHDWDRDPFSRVRLWERLSTEGVEFSRILGINVSMHVVSMNVKRLE